MVNVKIGWMTKAQKELTIQNFQLRKVRSRT